MNTVDEYIAKAPADVQDKLNQIRSIIKDLAPRAEEKLSYGMPYYGYNGRLVYFAYTKNHVGLYPMPPVIQDHAKDLVGYVTSKATVQFPLDRPLPMALIKKLVKACVANNEKKQKK